MKKLVSLVLALAMLMTMTVAVTASAEEYEPITIQFWNNFAARCRRCAHTAIKKTIRTISRTIKNNSSAIPDTNPPSLTA